MFSFLLALLVGITLPANCVADQIVYLDRPADSPNVEPWFNPANISAEVGEQIHFIARFTSSRVYDPAGYTPFEWAFAESTYEAPCVYNGGIYSGYFYVDVDGTWNGSSFTITVSDSDPHFFYFSTFREELYGVYCSSLASWASYYDLPVGDDVLFALNPNATQSSAGYKANVNNSNEVTIRISSVDYSPRGGQFVVISTNPYNTAATVANTTSNLPTNSTTCGGNFTQPTVYVRQGYSSAALGGGIAGGLVGGIVLGLVIMAVISAKGAKTSGAAAFDNELRTLGVQNRIDGGSDMLGGRLSEVARES